MQRYYFLEIITNVKAKTNNKYLILIRIICNLRASIVELV